MQLTRIGSLDGQLTADDPTKLAELRRMKFIATSLLVIAFVIFMLVRTINNMQKQEEEAAPPAPPEPSAEEKLLTEIRDLLAR